MDIFQLKNNSLFTIDEWEKNSSIAAGITNRIGGVSSYPKDSLNMAFHVSDELDHVVINRQKVAASLDFPLCNWVGAKQTHETHVHTVTSKTKGSGSFSYDTALEATDGLFTMDKDVLLTLCFADCVPIYFKSKDGKAVGIVHGGWRSTVGLINLKMIEIFEKNNINRNDIDIVIGPSICKSCYVVNSEVINHVQSIVDTNIIKPYEKIANDQYLLDLKHLNQLILLNANISSEQIKITDYCTSCSNDLFFSHRKEKGNTGRMMSYIGIRG